ncbi:cytochrome aa3 quinol oxidase subunit IV [Marinococcus luteus]|uniref:cytochrome aa3 quinol oxidase subunit IV n=1 Tax=Marinococcus luteus TaxID=1122204 RepID=UPI002ACD0623|nr:cytochrome aa3 quinol oxidase subunit IV [Marinococcus luteus]MDZ5784406.1 cytochrome aa3 quinol oxidase subunit IV [Marinococcus luteus]
MSEHTEHSESAIPVKHIIGFIASIVLTLVAAYTTVMSGLPVPWIIAIIMILAVIQAVLQLVMFMHIAEKNPVPQYGNILFGFFIAAVVIAGSIWVMSFGMHDMDMDSGGGSGGGSEEMDHSDH